MHFSAVPATDNLGSFTVYFVQKWVSIGSLFCLWVSFHKWQHWDCLPGLRTLVRSGQGHRSVCLVVVCVLLAQSKELRLSMLARPPNSLTPKW